MGWKMEEGTLLEHTLLHGFKFVNNPYSKKRKEIKSVKLGRKNPNCTPPPPKKKDERFFQTNTIPTLTGNKEQRKGRLIQGALSTPYSTLYPRLGDR